MIKAVKPITKFAATKIKSFPMSSFDKTKKKKKKKKAEICIETNVQFETFPQLSYFIFGLNTWEKFENFEK